MQIKPLLKIVIISSFFWLAGCASCGVGGCGYDECHSYGSRCGLPSCTYQCHVETFDYPCAGMYGCDGY